MYRSGTCLVEVIFEGCGKNARPDVRSARKKFANLLSVV